MIYASVATTADAQDEFSESKVFRKVKKVTDSGRQEIDEEELLKRKQRTDALSEERRRSIKQFLIENSTVLGNKKRVKKDLKERRVLNDSMRSLHKKYNETVTEEQRVGLTAFSQQRGGDILLQEQAKFVQCLCEICQNFKLMIQGLKKYCEQNNINLTFELTSHGMIAELLCNPDFLSPDCYECVLGKCTDCGEINFGELQNVCSEKLMYQSWGKEEGRKKDVVREASVQEICDMQTVQAKMMVVHLHDTRWQWNQFVTAKEGLEDEEVLMVLDFAENVCTTYKNEVSGAHWTYEQVTLHPFSVYYICPQDGEVVTDHITVVSDNMTHDAKAVKEYTREVLKFLDVKRGVTVKKLNQFSNGSASQYPQRTQAPSEDPYTTESGEAPPEDPDTFVSCQYI